MRIVRTTESPGAIDVRCWTRHLSVHTVTHVPPISRCAATRHSSPSNRRSAWFAMVATTSTQAKVGFLENVTTGLATVMENVVFALARASAATGDRDGLAAHPITTITLTAATTNYVALVRPTCPSRIGSSR